MKKGEEAPNKGMSYEEYYGKDKADVIRRKQRTAKAKRKEKLGYINSLETRRKIKETLLGHEIDDMTRNKIGNTLKQTYKNNPEIIEQQKESRKLSYNVYKIKEGRKKFVQTLKTNPHIMRKAGEKRHNTFLENPNIIERIKQSRAKQIFPIKDTRIEVKIQSLLKQLGYDFFTHQYMKEIEHAYQCDILIPSLHLVIECDGNYWHKYPVGKEVDHVRTKELIEKGFKVLRLWETEIKEMTTSKFKERLQNVM